MFLKIVWTSSPIKYWYNQRNRQLLHRMGCDAPNSFNIPHPYNNFIDRDPLRYYEVEIDVMDIETNLDCEIPVKVITDAFFRNHQILLPPVETLVLVASQTLSRVKSMASISLVQDVLDQKIQHCEISADTATAPMEILLMTRETFSQQLGKPCSLQMELDQLCSSRIRSGCGLSGSGDGQEVAENITPDQRTGPSQQFTSQTQTRDDTYFEKAQFLKEQTVLEFSQLAKQVQRDKLVQSGYFKSRKQLALYDDHDCFETPNIEDFDIRVSNRATLISHVRRVAFSHRFHSIVQSKRPCDMLKFSCALSPYFHHGILASGIQCPFMLVYRYDADEEEYFLESYDEMHNHVIDHTSGGSCRIMPYLKKHSRNPEFRTPQFGSFKLLSVPSGTDLASCVAHLARVRCFDASYQGATILDEFPRLRQNHQILNQGDNSHLPAAEGSDDDPNQTVGGASSLMQRPNSAVPEQLIRKQHTFKCTFLSHGQTSAFAYKRAAMAKSRSEQVDMIVQARKWAQQRYPQGSEKPYHIIACPFTLIYEEVAKERYKLIRAQPSHMHRVEF